MVSETLIRRGLTDVKNALAFINPELYIPSSATELSDLIRSVDRIKDAINRKEKILVWGDFDVDGLTSTTVLWSAIKQLGGIVKYHIPIREKESHGVQKSSLDTFLSKGIDLVLTCDTGISDIDAVNSAKNLGVDVIITDHHELPDILPESYAIINPQMLPDDHPLRELPGVGVVFKLIEALYKCFDKSEEVEQYLDLVALGIVADVAQIKKDNRYLLQRGMDVLRTTKRIGLQSLAEKCKIHTSEITEGHIGYSLAPRLNAIGRLDDASPVVELLTTSDRSTAEKIVDKLEDYNEVRKSLQQDVYISSKSQIESKKELLDYRALILLDHGWPPGVLGLVAGRLAREYRRPAILLTYSSDDVIRGSARSIDGINIKDVIADNSNLVLSYGGHAAAAGLRMREENISLFRKGISKTISSLYGDKPSENQIQIDGLITLQELNRVFVKDLQRLAPFGRGNPSLILATYSVEVKQIIKFGQGGEHLKLLVQDPEGTTQWVVWWRGDRYETPIGKFDIAYRVRTRLVNRWRNEHDVEVTWVDHRVRK